MVLLLSAYFCQLALYHSEHLSHRYENALCKLVLVIDHEPLAKHLNDLILEDLRDLKLVEGLLVEDLELEGSLGSIAELFIVSGLIRHLAEGNPCS